MRAMTAGNIKGVQMENVVWNWMVTKWNWPGAAAFCGAILMILAPVVLVVAGPVLFWIYLMLPLYMLHQLEEHAGDRFRIFVNETMGGGREVLSRQATFVINSLGVWGVDLMALYLAVFVNPGWGLMAFYLPLVNAVGHILQAVALKKYNPGLVTSILLFLPLASWGLLVVSKSTGAGWQMQLTGAGVAVFVHAMIIVHVKRELRRAGK